MSRVGDVMARVEHRPWAMPAGPWIMEQVWKDLLFMHWRVPAELVRRLVPAGLEVDTFDGSAWISVTPFHMSVRFRGAPLMPWMARIPEMNCRTYVAAKGASEREQKAGIYFFSLDCGSRAAVWGARTFYHLPYFLAKMLVEKKNEGGREWFRYESRRGEVKFRGEYEATSEVREAKKGTLNHWLTERYCLYSAWRGRAYRGEIHHAPWPLQEARVSIEENSVVGQVSGEIGGEPEAVSYSRELDVMIWGLRRVREQETSAGGRMV